MASGRLKIQVEKKIIPVRGPPQVRGYANVHLPSGNGAYVGRSSKIERMSHLRRGRFQQTTCLIKLKTEKTISKETLWQD